MKKHNVAKRLGIASLCLATAFSAFSGIASLGENVALAESSATDFIHTAVAYENVTINENGLLIESDEAYNATFKAVFTGNTTLNFRFPETYTDADGDKRPDAFYGNFKITITDATDDSNYFDIVYYAYTYQTDYFITSVKVMHNGQTRMTNRKGGTWYNTQKTGAASYAFGPMFQNYGFNTTHKDTYKDAICPINLVWTDDVLAVQAKWYDIGKSSGTTTIAAFDGTSSFVSKTSWGLPKLSFPNGYTIKFSSNVTSAISYSAVDGKMKSTIVDDKGTDVLFSSITTNDGATTYDFTTMTERPNDSQTQQFDNTFHALETQAPAAGKVFLGWRNTTTNALYPAYSIVRKVGSETCDPVVIDFDLINGASVRIDTVEYGQSGIRFQTMFKADEYETVKDYISEFGTLVAWTETLEEIGKEFTISNYQTSHRTVKKVENTKGVFDYSKGGNDYKAYSMAITLNPESYTQRYSARGYLVVKYVDNTTRTIYTDYNAAENSRSVAEVAYRLKTNDQNAYSALSTAEKNVIDDFANAYVIAEA